MSMKSMFEVVFHGRGGQGAKIASQMLVETAAESGKFVQAFPEFGPERRGAPVKAFARISNSPIITHQPVTNPDAAIVLDEGLLSAVNVISGLEKGVLIVNTSKTSDDIRKRTGFRGKIFTVNASQIAIDMIGKDITNTPMLGALAKATRIVSVDSISKKVEDTFLKKIGDKATKANVDMVRRAYEECK